MDTQHFPNDRSGDLAWSLLDEIVEGDTDAALRLADVPYFKGIRRRAEERARSPLPGQLDAAGSAVIAANWFIGDYEVYLPVTRFEAEGLDEDGVMRMKGKPARAHMIVRDGRIDGWEVEGRDRILRIVAQVYAHQVEDALSLDRRGQADERYSHLNELTHREGRHARSVTDNTPAPDTEAEALRAVQDETWHTLYLPLFLATLTPAERQWYELRVAQQLELGAAAVTLWGDASARHRATGRKRDQRLRVKLRAAIDLWRGSMNADLAVRTSIVTLAAVERLERAYSLTNARLLPLLDRIARQYPDDAEVQAAVEQLIAEASAR